MAKTKKKDKSTKQKKNDDGTSSSSTASAGGVKRKRKEVQVVVCPSAFPDFTTVGGSTSRRREQQRSGISSRANRDSNKDETAQQHVTKGPELDVQETIREIHKFGAEGFTGKQKKSHQAAEYERLTGRVAKRQKIPTKILVGMRKKAMKREEREKQELKESGVVGHYSTNNTASSTAAASSSGSSKRKNRNRKQKEDELGGAVVQGPFGANRARNKGDRRKMTSRSFGPTPDVGFMHKGMLKAKLARR